MAVRCRKCSPCLRARLGYWVSAATHETRLAAESGNRTWFGTLTFSREWQNELLQRAIENYGVSHEGSEMPDWFGDPLCEERFRYVREEARKEVQRYWKRLRKAGLRFRYLVVIERHKSGLPHLHWLLHEKGTKCLKRQLQEQWPHGFTNVKLVGGRRQDPAGAAKAAFYVAKYLSKSVQARQMASTLYRPSVRRTKD